MSTQKRKISYWSFDFLSGDKHSFDPEVFCGFMAYLKGVDSQRLLHRDEKQNKAIALESIHEEVKQGLRLYKVIFKSSDRRYILSGFKNCRRFGCSLPGFEKPT